MAKRKSEHYNWFNANNNKNALSNSPKNNWIKTSLKVLKIIAYVMLFGLSLTGCAQSFAVPSNKETGSGVEFYSSKDKIAPHVVTLNESNIYGKQIPTLTPDTRQANYWVRNTQILNELKNQEPNLGKWKSKTQTLRIVDNNNEPIGGSELIKNSNNNKYYVANDQDLDYNIQNLSSTIYSIVDKNTKGSLLDLVKKGAKWGDLNNYLLPTNKSNNKKVSDIKFYAKNTEQKVEQKFGIDVYAYLSNKYLSKLPATPHKGDLVSNEWKAWITNYTVIAETTGWFNKYNSKNKTANYSYADKTSSKEIASLSFESMKPQRAIYSWGGSWHLGPFYALFVYPLATLTGKLIHGMPQMNGWEAILAIMVVVILVRSIAYALSFKSTLQSVKQQEVQAKVAIINAKYEPYKGNKQMDRRKQQEVAELYKREGVSIFGAFSQMFITMPLFISMLKVVDSTPSLKSTIWLGINFASTSYHQLFKGEWQYLPLMVITASVQAMQAITPRLFSKRREKNRVNFYQKQALKKSNKTQNIMIGVFVFMALVVTAGLQVYWFFSGLYTLGQNVINHYIIKHQSKKRKRKIGY